MTHWAGPKPPVVGTWRVLPARHAFGLPAAEPEKMPITARVLNADAARAAVVVAARMRPRFFGPDIRATSVFMEPPSSTRSWTATFLPEVRPGSRYQGVTFA
jgi:hypothetical protein